jgi:hypothetical protein
MLITLFITITFFSHNLFALSLGNPGTQFVLSGDNSPATPPIFEHVDISEGWADPRINGGRLLDVSASPCCHPRRTPHPRC